MWESCSLWNSVIMFRGWNKCSYELFKNKRKKEKGGEHLQLQGSGTLLDVVYQIPWPSSHPKVRLDMPRDCSEEQRIQRAGSVFISPPRQSEGVWKGLSSLVNEQIVGLVPQPGVQALGLWDQAFLLVKTRNRNPKELCFFWIWDEVASGRSVVPSILNGWGNPNSQLGAVMDWG